MMSGQQSCPRKSFYNVVLRSQSAKSISPDTARGKHNFLAAPCRPDRTCKPHCLRSASVQLLRDMDQASVALTSGEITECEASSGKALTCLTRSGSELSVRRGSKDIRQDFVQRSSRADSLVRSGRSTRSWSGNKAAYHELFTDVFDIDSDSVSLDEHGTSSEDFYKTVIDYTRNASSRTSITARFGCQEIQKVDICCSEVMGELIEQSAERIQMMKNQLAVMHIRRSKDVKDQLDDTNKSYLRSALSSVSTQLGNGSVCSNLSDESWSIIHDKGPQGTIFS